MGLGHIFTSVIGKMEFTSHFISARKSKSGNYSARSRNLGENFAIGFGRVWRLYTAANPPPGVRNWIQDPLPLSNAYVSLHLAEAFHLFFMLIKLDFSLKIYVILCLHNRTYS